MQTLVEIQQTLNKSFKHQQYLYTIHFGPKKKNTSSQIFPNPIFLSRDPKKPLGVVGFLFGTSPWGSLTCTCARRNKDKSQSLHLTIFEGFQPKWKFGSIFFSVFRFFGLCSGMSLFLASGKKDGPLFFKVCLGGMCGGGSILQDYESLKPCLGIRFLTKTGLHGMLNKVLLFSS